MSDDDEVDGIDEVNGSEYTLHEASQLFGMSRRLLSQAVVEGKLDARLTAARSGYKENGVPVYLVAEAEMIRFKLEYTPSMLSGIGANPDRRKKASGPRTTEDEAEMFRRRREVEDRAAARDLGVSYQEYLSYVS